ncbi:MAG: hypothetical protein JSV79_02660 [Armatimonadota bacterium]|nr:MAG: hypothetical protein JSV79_02660 [Armatimonadota bacterium]
MHTDTVSEQTSLHDRPQQEGPANTTSPAREAVNLRLVLELRRRLKSAAEKELAIASDRMRALRGQLRRAESELRLCAQALETRSRQLTEAAKRVQQAQARATQTCGRLSSLEHEHQDLANQLAAAQQDADRLQLSVRSGSAMRNGTLDSFTIAAAALISDLEQAITDQSAVQARGRDLIEESESCAARARSLQKCFDAINHAMTSLRKEVSTTLGSLHP